MDLPPFEKVGEQFRNITNRLDQIEQSLYQKIGGNRPLAYFGAALANISLLAAGVSAADAHKEAPPAQTVVCGDSCAPKPETQILARQAESTAPEKTPVSNIAIKREIPPVEGIDTLLNERMREVPLTMTGFETFLNELDTTFVPFSLNVAEFNPLFNRKAQKQTTKIMNHYTVDYYNVGGAAKTPVGQADPGVFINAIANRYGSVLSPKGSECCGSNLLIDRHGRSFLLTSMNTKTQHNPPNDEDQFAIDVEAADMHAISPKQFEILSYANILVLLHTPNLVNVPLENSIDGHCKDRTKLREQLSVSNPAKLEVFPPKKDFCAPEIKLQQLKIADFFERYPQAKQMRLPQLP